MRNVKMSKPKPFASWCTSLKKCKKGVDGTCKGCNRFEHHVRGCPISLNYCPLMVINEFAKLIGHSCINCPIMWTEKHQLFGVEALPFTLLKLEGFQMVKGDMHESET